MPTHTPTIRHPADDLLAELALVHVLEPEQVETARIAARTAGAATDDVTLAEFLVSRGVLTRFQADRAVAGEADQLTAGPYLLLEPLGSGGLGTVYRARRRSDRKPHAVKVLPTRERWNLLRAMEQLAAIGGNPPHPAVVPFTDLGDDDGEYYLAWPLVEGESFERSIEQTGPPEPVRAARLAAEVADGLAVCHRHGVTHGLVKPSNLLAGPDGTARVLELGVGAILADNITDAASLDDARSSGGWLDCAAPEVLADPTRLTPAGDAYSLGCVLYFLLTGKYPFPNGTPAEKMAAHRSRSPAPVRSLRPEVPVGLAELVARLMRKDPADRPTDLAAVRTALLAIREPEPEAIPLAVVQPAPKRTGLPKSPTPPPDLPCTHSTGQVLCPETLPEMGRTPRPHETALPNVVEPPATPGRSSFWRRVTRTVVPWGGSTEPIQLSVYGPRGLAHGTTTPILIFSHRPELFDRLRTLSMAHLPGSELLAAGYTNEPIPRGGEVWLHLAVEGAGAVVAPPLVKFPWQDESKLTTFNVTIPSWTKPVEKADTSLTVGLNGYEAAVLRFDLAVLPPARAEE
ncbi:MAG TPA: protein kinase [Fimbriiglobus sp.]|nr:protein kinase [Fimbriiglobus sp.]